MPYVRMSVLEGKPPAFLAALSESVHRALVETFDVPPDDRFHVIEQCAPCALVFDRHYLGGPRSDEFVLLQITAGRPRSEQQTRDLYRRLVALLGVAPGIAPGDVMVVIQTTRTLDWSFGQGISAVDAMTDCGGAAAPTSAN